MHFWNAHRTIDSLSSLVGRTRPLESRRVLMNQKIEISDTGIPHGVRHIAEQLPSIENLSSGDQVTLEFSGDFVYLTGLTMLACWRKALPAGIQLSVDDSSCTLPTQKFLSNTGFREIIETGVERPSARGRVGKIPLQPITNRLSSEATVAEITSIFEEYAGHIQDTNPFTVLLSELGENVLAHSEQVSPGYACARVLPSARKTTAEICICDTGIGIRESFLRGTNEIAKQRIAKGANPLEIAVEGLNSSKPQARAGSYKSYYGFGLLVTRRLVQENRGQMVILSGDTELVIDHYDIQSRTVSRPFPGTFIGIILDLDNPLPLDEIYEEADQKLMPPDLREAPQESGQSNGKSIGEEAIADLSVPELDDEVEDNSASDLSSFMEMRHYGTELLTRETGVIIRADLATLLVTAQEVQVSFKGITDITPSVVDEAFGKLATGMGFDEFSHRVKFADASRLIERLIEFVLKTRKTRQ